MSEYLSKEEIKQWRSSLEKITLEEFAARLGKKVEEKKETNDLIDIVLHGKPVVSDENDWSSSKVERLSAIADRAYEKEKELYISPFSAQNLKIEDSKSEVKVTKTEAQEKNTPIKKAPKAKLAPKKAEKTLATAKEIIKNQKSGDSLRDDVRIVFKKALTDREQKVFDYFAANKNKIVYAKDLATFLIYQEIMYINISKILEQK